MKNKQKQKRILLGYRNREVDLYKPKVNKLKFAGVLVFVGTCLITPCTNWLIPVVGKTIDKFNPLWIYR